MNSFFDKYERDQLIMAWLKKHDKKWVRHYEYFLAKREEYKEVNDMFLLAFEAGMDFVMTDYLENE